MCMEKSFLQHKIKDINHSKMFDYHAYFNVYKFKKKVSTEKCTKDKLSRKKINGLKKS